MLLAAAKLADLNRGARVYGIPRGGAIVASMMVAGGEVELADSPEAATLIVDDLVDSGATRARYADAYPDTEFVALYDKQQDDAEYGWIVFPWEERDESSGPEENVRRLIEFVGENPDRSGLTDTPRRVVKAWSEMTRGYAEDPAAILSRVFDESSDEMILVRDVRFTSLCEHHVLPFTGVAHVAYIPDKKVVGLSKIPRLVDCYARRLQIQERLTRQIGEAIEAHLCVLGVGVIVAASHACMACRGVHKPEASMVTSYLSGSLRDDARARAELFSLIGCGR